MKTDLASSIGAAVAGILIAYFICNLFIGPIEDVSFTTVDSSIGTDLDEPSPEFSTIEPLIRRLKFMWATTRKKKFNRFK